MMSSTSGSTVYRFRNNFHFSVFLVTPEGVIATDPIHADTPRIGQSCRELDRPFFVSAEALALIELPSGTVANACRRRL